MYNIKNENKINERQYSLFNVYIKMYNIHMYIYIYMYVLHICLYEIFSSK